MIQNQPVEALRTLSATVYDANGDLLPAATSWVAGMVKISKAGGAFTNTTNLPTSVSGGGDGDFDLILTVGEVDTIGNLRVRFYDDAVGTTLLAEYVDQVTSSTTQTSGGSGSTPSTGWAFFGGGILKADVLAIAPQLSSLSDAAWFTILAFVNTFQLPTVNKPLRRLALIFLAAHLGTVAGAGGMGASGATGPVISESAGGLKRTYAQATVTSSNSDLGATSYGIQYMAILKMSPEVRGPFLI